MRILALTLIVAAALFALPASAVGDATCSVDSAAPVALSDLGTNCYKGAPGGLYPAGSDDPPSAYASEGLGEAGLVKPRSENGQASSTGTIGLLSLGMSNASMEWSVFKSSWMSNSRRNPAVKFVDGAQPGMTLDQIAYPTSPQYQTFWNTVAIRVRAAGLSAEQVQVIWLKDTIAYLETNAGSFPQSALLTKSYLRAVIDTAAGFLPNLRLVYVSSRIYSGYSEGVTDLSPEPYAYEDGFSVKRLIEERIATPGDRPWIGWGPYLWANGTTARTDGYSQTRTWVRSDFQADGVHPTASGSNKVAGALGDFFSTAPSAKKWFLSS